jgi:hypothetical protein
VIATSPASMPLQAMVMSGLPKHEVPERAWRGRAGDRSQIGIYGDHGDAQVGGAQRGAGVEAHPAEKQNEGAGDHVDDVVRGEDADFSVRAHICRARSQNNGQRHGAETADGVDHGGSGEIDVAVAEIQRRADLREPAAAPGPAAGDGIENRADEKFAEQERPEGDALADAPTMM